MPKSQRARRPFYAMFSRAELIDRMLDPDPAKRIGMQNRRSSCSRFERPSGLQRSVKLAVVSASFTVAAAVILLFLSAVSGSASRLAPSFPRSNRFFAHDRSPSGFSARIGRQPIDLTRWTLDIVLVPGPFG